jgi:hypothetical protein
MPVPRGMPRPRGGFARCGVATMLIDGEGRADARMAAEFGLMDRTRVPLAAAGAAPRSRTIEFLVEPFADGRSRASGGFRRLMVGAFADSRRKAGPGRFASRRADALPDRDGMLIADAAGGPQHASHCARNRPQVANRKLAPGP